MAGFNPFAALYAGMKIKKGPAPISARTPSFAGGMYKGASDPGNTMDAGPDSGYTPQQVQEAKLVANPPQEGVKADGTKIGGLRRVLGTIASTVGPMIGGPAVAGLGDKLLYPGRDKYNSDLARAQRLSALSVDARNHQDLEANRQFMRDARTDAQQARQDTLNEQQRQHALGQIEQIRKDGGREIDDAPTIPESRQTLRPQMPTAVNQPAPPPQIVPQNVQGPSPVEQIDDETGKPMSQVGRVEEIAVPGQAKPTRMVRLSAQSKRDAAATDLKAKTAATKETWETITPDIATALNLPVGMKVPSMAPYASMYEAKLKDNNLHFESNTNEETGDVTTRGFDAKTGDVKFAHTAKGEAKKRPQAINIHNQQAMDPVAIESYVRQMKENPDIYHEIGNPDLKNNVAMAWEKSTGLPVPRKISTQAQDSERMSQLAIAHIGKIREILADPEIQKNIGPIAGRMGTLEQNVGDTFFKTGPQAAKEQELRTRLRYLLFQEGKALLGGRPAAVLIKELEQASANPKMSMDIMAGALNGAEGAGKLSIEEADRYRFGGKKGRGDATGAPTATPTQNAPVKIKYVRDASGVFVAEKPVKQ